MSDRGLVCSAHPLASRTGIAILDSGGNFIDAAIATSAVLNVVEPYNSHLGGDAFLLAYRSSTGLLEAVNSSGPAPTSASIEAFADGVPVHGIRAVSVPGQVRAWKLAHEEYGRLPWPDLLAPALRYAKEGFPCNSRLSSAIKSASLELKGNSEWRKVFMPGGEAPRPGHIFVQTDLARSLRTLSDEGPDAFYEGRIAEAVCEFARNAGGLLGMEDMASFESEVLVPIRTTYRSFEVFEQPPVSQGHILLEELNIVEGFELSSLEPDGPESVHLLVEAKKLAFADRYAHSGDPRFISFPLQTIISKEHAAARRKLIDPERAKADYPSPSPACSGADTTYFAIADGEGNAVSFIQSLFHSFGSGVVVPNTGILLNNRMTGFSLNPASPNRLVGGKRTMHTLNTYMVFDEGSPLFVGGTPGGDRQVQTNLQVITRLLDWGMNVQEAAEYPRWAGHDGLSLSLESRYPVRTVTALRSLGHRLELVGPWDGGGAVQLIMIHPESRALIGGSDPRCDGCALGL